MVMMSFINPLGYLLFFCGVGYLIYTLVSGSIRPDATGKQKTAEFDATEDSGFILIFQPFYRILTPFVHRLPVPGYKRRVQSYVITAGLENQVTGDDIIGFQITVMLLFGIVGMVLSDSTVTITLSAAFGLVYPYLWLREKKTQRQERIKLSMPDVVDMLSLSVEAGLSFNAAVQKVCDIYRHDKDPFVVELYLMDQNIKLGRSRVEALKVMADRVDLMELDSFASILIQANKMGSSIADVLKSQADRMRSERFLKAEKIGAQASQKLLIPMMVFIFPIIFIVIFGPYLVKWITG
ncbi:MAG: type II secretion system F family protein [Desulfobacteraceae bacterium]|nr:MAG: type II secretion system F family protein [Desulfobacteraceae bacterium]